MSHELDVLANGNAAMIFAAAGGTPWHQLGTPIPHEAFYDLDYAMELAGLDFRVAKVPHFVLKQTFENDPAGAFFQGLGWVRPIKSNDGASIIRTDRDVIVGTVGNIYHPLQNSQMVAPVKSVVAEGLAAVETGGSLREGRQTWLLLRFKTDRILARAKEMVHESGLTASEVAGLEDALLGEAEQGILPYALLTTDHTGRAKARLKETAIRVVCANTIASSLGATEGGMDIAVAHNRQVKENWQAATDALFRNVVMRFVGMANYRRILKAAELDDRSFIDLVLDATVPVKQLEEKIRRRDGTAHTTTALEKAGEKRAEITRLWTGGRGQTGDKSAWEAYQGVIEYLDHDERSVGGGSDRIQSMVDGSVNKAKTNVFRNLMGYAVNRAEGEGIVAELLGRDTAPVVRELLSARN